MSQIYEVICDALKNNCAQFPSGKMVAICRVEGGQSSKQQIDEWRVTVNWNGGRRRYQAIRQRPLPSDSPSIASSEEGIQLDSKQLFLYVNSRGSRQLVEAPFYGNSDRFAHTEIAPDQLWYSARFFNSSMIDLVEDALNPGAGIRGEQVGNIIGLTSETEPGVIGAPPARLWIKCDLACNGNVVEYGVSTAKVFKFRVGKFKWVLHNANSWRLQAYEEVFAESEEDAPVRRAVVDVVEFESPLVAQSSVSFDFNRFRRQSEPTISYDATGPSIKVRRPADSVVGEALLLKVGKEMRSFGFTEK